MPRKEQDLFDLQRIRSSSRIDPGRQSAITPQNAAELLSALRKDEVNRPAELRLIDVRRRVLRLDREHDAFDLRWWPETVRAEGPDRSNVGERSDEDRERTVLPSARVGEKSVPDLSLNRDELPKAVPHRRQQGHDGAGGAVRKIRDQSKRPVSQRMQDVR